MPKFCLVGLPGLSHGGGVRSPRTFLPALSLLLAGTRLAGVPELSTGPGENIAFDQQRGALVARGDAALSDDDFLLRAEEIGFYQKEQQAEARGRVEATREGIRVLADSALYRLQEKSLQASRVRAGVWPLLVEADSLQATRETLAFTQAVAHYGEPHPLGLSLRADTLRYFPATGRLEAQGARLKLGPFPGIPVGRFSRDVAAPPILYEGEAGYRGNLGAFLKNEILVPWRAEHWVGANLDLYSDRGLLLGPAWELGGLPGPGRSNLDSFSSGWIRDQGDTGLDLLGRPIDPDRYFAEWRHRQEVLDQGYLLARLAAWSDSEVTRDFRPGFFDHYQFPDSFAEASLRQGPWVVSAFTRLRPNDFQDIRERLPEMRLDLAPTRLGPRHILHTGFASAARLREQPPGDTLPTLESTRLDGGYALYRPIRLHAGATLTPRAAGRLTHYLDTLGSASPYTRALGELGLDLDLLAHAVWDLQAPAWGLHGLRHIVAPHAHYRWRPGPGAGASAIPSLDREVFTVNRPPLDLLLDRETDALQGLHLVRVGLDNRLQTRDQQYGSRDWLTFNLNQDLLIDPESGQNTLDALWAEWGFLPASWLRLNFFSRIEADGFVFDEFHTRLDLVDGSRWRLSLGNEFLNHRIEQYRAEGEYHLNRRFGLWFLLRWDNKIATLTEQVYGVSQQWGPYLRLLYGLRVREGSTREDDVQLSLSVRVTGF